MRVYIHHTISFKLGQFIKRTEILKAKIDYLKQANYSDVMIEGLLYAQNYSLKEINCFLSSFVPTFKYDLKNNTMQLI
jgi:hypothetical protein